MYYKSYPKERKVQILQSAGITASDDLTHAELNDIAIKFHLMQPIKQLEVVKTTRSGLGVKGRTSSTKNGAVHSFVNYHAPKDYTTDEEIASRNKHLGIKINVCFWCNTNPKEAMDHMVPVSCPKHNIIGTSSKLNMVPSCTRCNSHLKGGKPPEIWIEHLQKHFPDVWTKGKVKKLRKYIDDNKSKLYFDENVTTYMFQELYPGIQKFHTVLEECIKNKNKLSEYIIYK